MQQITVRIITVKNCENNNCEKFLRRIQLKAFFHDKEDNSNASDKDIFETLHACS